MIEFDKEQPGKTNLDKLREISAEEMAAFIEKGSMCCNHCPIKINKTGIRCSEVGKDCVEVVLYWLNSPVEESK